MSSIKFILSLNGNDVTGECHFLKEAQPSKKCKEIEKLFVNFKRKNLKLIEDISYDIFFQVESKMNKL